MSIDTYKQSTSKTTVVGRETSFGYSAGSGGEYFEPTYTVDGSDLYIGTPEEMAQEVEAYLGWLNRKAEREGVRVEDIDPKLYEEAQYVQEAFQRRLDELSEHDMKYAHAVQDWVLDELRTREQERGQEYHHTSEKTYLETAEVLSLLIQELTADNEDQKLINIATVWRQETLAELNVAQLRTHYSLAA